MTPRQHKALQCLLTEPTRAAAAKKAGIGESTLREYFKSSEFRAEYEKAVGSIIEDAVMKARQSVAPAVDTLSEIMQTGEISQRLAAAKSTIELYLKLDERANIERRLFELERAQKECENNE